MQPEEISPMRRDLIGTRRQPLARATRGGQHRANRACAEGAVLQGNRVPLPYPVACPRQPRFRREFWTMAIGSDLAIVDMGAGTDCLEWIASLTLNAQVVLVDHTLTREELHVRIPRISPAQQQRLLFIGRTLECCFLLGGARLVQPATSHVGKLVIMLSSLWYQACPAGHLLRQHLCLWASFVVPGLSCSLTLNSRFVLFDLLVGGTRLVLLATRAVGMWYQACPVGHVWRGGAPRNRARSLAAAVSDFPRGTLEICCAFDAVDTVK